MRGHAQGTVGPRREALDRDDLLDAIHYLYRGGLEDHPEPAQGLAQTRQDERTRGPADRPRQHPLFWIRSILLMPRLSHCSRVLILGAPALLLSSFTGLPTRGVPGNPPSPGPLGIGPVGLGPGQLL